MKSSILNWVGATRPRTLCASVAPVAIGSAMAANDSAFHAPSAGAALSGALGIQIACNFANDYFDARKGADTADRLGPTRAVASGLISAKAMVVAAMMVLALVVVPSVVLLAVRAGWAFIILGALAILLAIAYTGGRWSLAYLGLGDPFAFAFFGPVAVGATYAVQSGSWKVAPFIGGIAPGLLACAIITINNLRDIPTDEPAGKRTLAVRLGARFARREYLFCVLLSAATVAGMAIWFGKFPALAGLFATVTLVPAMRRVMGGIEGRELNRVLGETARALFLLGILFSIGWLG